MISHKIYIKNGEIQQEHKLTKDTPEQDIAFMIYMLQKKINELLNLEFDNKDVEVKYDIDENGDPIDEDEGK